jgi:alkylhydroperoxidase/carboxymuconolactone decarboxylase family protein YurZ
LHLGILAGLGVHQELGIYTKVAIRNGVTVDALKEILVHVNFHARTRLEL